MLVVVTNREDLTADWLVVELDRRAACFLRLNTEDYPASSRLRWTLQEASLEIHGQLLAAQDVTAVWWRRPLPPNGAGEGRSAAEAEWASGEAEAALEGFWSATSPRWVNHPTANASADCKPEQLRRAVGTGFRVPPTLVTNDAEAIRDFARREGRVVIKSLREGRVPFLGAEHHFYTSELSTGDLGHLEDFGPEPYLVQALVEKQYDVRVTVIGDAAYACRIESQHLAEGAIDWRKVEVEDAPHSVELLPSETRDACVALTHAYGLRFSAIDLARTSDGGYSFFELNPNGQWAWVEQLTGLPLRARLADELLEGA